MKRKCAGCGAKFTPERKNQRNCSPRCRKARYERSDKARMRKKRYEASVKGKAASEKYAATSKGKARHLRHYYKDRPGEFLAMMKNHAQWTQDVHAYAEKHGVRLLEALNVASGWWPHREDYEDHEQRLRFLRKWFWKELHETGTSPPV